MKTIPLYHRNVDVSMTLEELGDEYGLTRERIRQIEAAALHKLARSEKHLRQVEWRLEGALSRYRAAKKRDDVPEMWKSINEVDELADALQWLRAARNGDLESLLRDAQQRQDEPTQYVSTVHYTDALMPQPHAKWTSYALTAPRRK